MPTSSEDHLASGPITIVCKAAENGQVKEIKLQKSKGFDILFIKDYYGDSPLHNAAKGDQKSHLEVARYLIDQAGDRASEFIELTNNKQETALAVAVNHRSVGIVKLLLDKGANPSPRNNRQETPLHHAFTSLEILEMLIDSCKDKGLHQELNAMDMAGGTPLLYAADEGEPTVVEMLLRETQGEAVNWRKGEGQSDRTKGSGVAPIHLAAQKNHVDSLRHILNFLPHEDSVSLVSLGNNWTALHYACSFGSTEAAKLLLENNIDKTIRSEKNETAYSLAKQFVKNHKDRQDLLALFTGKNEERRECEITCSVM